MSKVVSYLGKEDKTSCFVLVKLKMQMGYILTEITKTSVSSF